MSNGKVPSGSTSDQPEKYQNLLKEDRGDDCLACRIIGGGAFLGLAAYSYYSGHSQLDAQKAMILKSKSMFGMRSRRMGITSISLTLAWMGLWRLFK